MDSKWQVGAKVVVDRNGVFSVSRIKLVGKRSFKLEDGSSWDRGGWVYPKENYPRSRAELATPELLAKVRRCELIRLVRVTSFDKLPTEKLEAIIDILASK